MNLVRYADRPDLLERRYRTLSAVTFPEYMQHNDPGNLDGEELVAEAHAVPVAWDGTPEDLPAGWDEAFVRGMTSDREPTVLSALVISVLPERQGQRLSSRMLQAFRDTARAAGLEAVIAPVRPTLKER